MGAIGIQECDEAHPDVVWVEEAAVKAACKPARGRKDKQDGFDIDEQLEPVLRESKSLPGTHIDITFGQCLCWICRDTRLAQHESEWMLHTLAKHVLNLPRHERATWTQDWTRRHGQFAGAVLQRHINWINAINGVANA